MRKLKKISCSFEKENVSRNWPSREEWARRRQTVYFDMENLNPATRALSAYASPAEIEAAIASMKSLRR
jgi:hypothetical protein